MALSIIFEGTAWPLSIILRGTLPPNTSQAFATSDAIATVVVLYLLF